MVTALMVKPDEHPLITHICDNTEFLNMAVSVDTIVPCSAQAIRLEKDIAIIHAQEGVLLSLPGNRRVNDHIIAGTFYVVGVKDGKLRSLTDAEIVKYTSQFWETEIFTDNEVLDSYFDNIIDSL